MSSMCMPYSMVSLNAHISGFSFSRNFSKLPSFNRARRPHIFQLAIDNGSSFAFLTKGFVIVVKARFRRILK